MPTKERPAAGSSGLDFHLASDPEATRHDDAWRQERAKKLMKKHEG